MKEQLRLMKNFFFGFVILAIILNSCKETAKGSVSNFKTKQVVKKRNISEYIVFEDSFLEPKTGNYFYKNIEFRKEGAFFSSTNNSPSYIELPFFNLDLSIEFNISFSYNTISDVGSKPQSFITFSDNYSSPTKSVPLFIYTAGNRITGVYGDLILWAEKYKSSLGASKDYYDSYQLKANETYFVSFNFTGSKIDIYVNSELYSSFSNVKPHSLNYDKVTLGVFPQDKNEKVHFKGAINGLKVFSTALYEDEIADIYKNQYYLSDH